jgi:type IV fimbrial biogenesis protein FimT
MQRKRFPAFQRGLSLVEICVVLAIVSILAGTALPSFDSVLESRRLVGQAAELALDLRYVRSEAVSRNEGVRVSFQTPAGGSCTIVHTGAATDCTCDVSGVAHCSNGATALKTTFYPVGRGTSVDANVASMRFDPINGTVSPAGTVRVTTSSGAQVHHVVNILGRVRTCSPGGSAKGYKVC